MTKLEARINVPMFECSNAQITEDAGSGAAFADLNIGTFGH
jgi:hypothetical protein